MPHKDKTKKIIKFNKFINILTFINGTKLLHIFYIQFRPIQTNITDINRNKQLLLTMRRITHLFSTKYTFLHKFTKQKINF